MTSRPLTPVPPRARRVSLLAVGLALALVLSAGLVHGLWIERWLPSTALEQALTLVPLVPKEFSGWTGKTPETEMDPEVFRQAGAQAYWTRVYTNPDKPGAFSVILMCGRAGRMAVHTPEVCYRGAGYELMGTADQRTVTFDTNQTGHFWSARFAKDTGKGMDLRLFWAWNAWGEWEAPTSPRWTFRGQPFLFKLYVGREVTDTAAGPGEEPTLDFLHDFLPVLEAALFPTRNTGEE